MGLLRMAVLVPREVEYAVNECENLDWAVDRRHQSEEKSNLAIMGREASCHHGVTKCSCNFVLRKPSNLGIAQYRLEGHVMKVDKK